MIDDVNQLLYVVLSPKIPAFSTNHVNSYKLETPRILLCLSLSKNWKHKAKYRKLLVPPPKIQKNKCQKKLKIDMFKWTNGLSGNDYRVASFFNSYLTPIEIFMQSLNSIGQL